MQKKLYCKSLVIGIIVIFIGAGLSSAYVNVEIKSLIKDNQPPSAPSISGPIEGVVGVEYYYTFATMDPEGDDVRFHIHWGDGTSNITDFYKSGEVATVGHTYYHIGTVIITAYAEDIHGAVGPESTYIPEWKNRAVNFNLLGWLFERFPLLEVFLRIMNL